MFFWKWNHFVLCMEGSMCGGTWVISHVNGCFYCQFSILHWQWHGFSLKQKKTTWLEHFFYSIFSWIYLCSPIILQLFATCSFYFNALSVSFQRGNMWPIRIFHPVQTEWAHDMERSLCSFENPCRIYQDEGS